MCGPGQYQTPQAPIYGPAIPGENSKKSSDGRGKDPTSPSTPANPEIADDRNVLSPPNTTADDGKLSGSVVAAAAAADTEGMSSSPTAAAAVDADVEERSGGAAAVDPDQKASDTARLNLDGVAFYTKPMLMGVPRKWKEDGSPNVQTSFSECATADEFGKLLWEKHVKAVEKGYTTLVGKLADDIQQQVKPAGGYTTSYSSSAGTFSLNFPYEPQKSDVIVKPLNGLQSTYKDLIEKNKTSFNRTTAWKILENLSKPYLKSEIDGANEDERAKPENQLSEDAIFEGLDDKPAAKVLMCFLICETIRFQDDGALARMAMRAVLNIYDDTADDDPRPFEEIFISESSRTAAPSTESSTTTKKKKAKKDKEENFSPVIFSSTGGKGTMNKLIRFFGKLEKSVPFNGCVRFFFDKNNGYISDVGDTGGKGMEKPKPSTPTTRSRRKIHNPSTFTFDGQRERPSTATKKEPESPTKFPNTSSSSNSDTVAESAGKPASTSNSSSTPCTSPKKKKAHTADSTGEEAVNSDSNITPIQFNLDDTT